MKNIYKLGLAVLITIAALFFYIDMTISEYGLVQKTAVNWEIYKTGWGIFTLRQLGAVVMLLALIIGIFIIGYFALCTYNSDEKVEVESVRTLNLEARKDLIEYEEKIHAEKLENERNKKDFEEKTKAYYLDLATKKYQELRRPIEIAHKEFYAKKDVFNQAKDSIINENNRLKAKVSRLEKVNVSLSKQLSNSRKKSKSLTSKLAEFRDETTS